jgi:hypothetical protein
VAKQPSDTPPPADATVLSEATATRIVTAETSAPFTAMDTSSPFATLGTGTGSSGSATAIPLPAKSSRSMALAISLGSVAGLVLFALTALLLTRA